MSVYSDTSSPGGSGALTASRQIFNFGVDTDFYLAVASNNISGQATGPSVQFLIYSHRLGRQPSQVDYGTTNTTFPVRMKGYLVEAVVPTVGGSVSCRVVVSSDPFPLTVVTVPAATVSVSGTVDVNLTEVVGVAPTTPGKINTDIGSTNPDPLALEAGGNLALTGSSTATIASTVGTAPTVAKVTTQT